MSTYYYTPKTLLCQCFYYTFLPLVCNSAKNKKPIDNSAHIIVVFPAAGGENNIYKNFKNPLDRSQNMLYNKIKQLNNYSNEQVII